MVGNCIFLLKVRDLPLFRPSVFLQTWRCKLSIRDRWRFSLSDSVWHPTTTQSFAASWMVELVSNHERSRFFSICPLCLASIWHAADRPAKRTHRHLTKKTRTVAVSGSSTVGSKPHPRLSRRCSEPTRQGDLDHG